MDLLDKVENLATSKPDAWAIIHPRFRITWKQFNTLILNCAFLISSKEVRRESIVGISQTKSLMNLITSLALMKLGISFVDVSDNESSFRETKKILGIEYVISDTRKSFYDTPTIYINNLLDFTNLSEFSESELRFSKFASFFIKTSGTTGESKYISLTQAKIVARFDTYSSSLGFAEGDLFWTPISTSFSSSKLRYFAAIYGGATLIFGCKLTSQGITFLNSIGITKVFCTPSQLFKFIEIGIALPTCKSITASTSFISEKLRREFKNIVSSQLFVVYGTAESGAVTEADPYIQERAPNTVGVAYPQVEIQIVDSNDSIVPAGIPGYIRIKSPGMCEDYFQDSRISKLSFRDGWFYPGDLGYFDSESSLILLGRSDDMFIFDGVNIHPLEIEDVLCLHHGVIEAAAFSIPHQKYGDIPVAVVIPRGNISELELKKYCSSKLGIKTPKKIFFTEEFPRSDIGKILRKELTKMYSGEKIVKF